MTCPKCKTPRRYIGVMCPARRLCPCEKGKTCEECGAAATTVEFQGKVDDGEPALPATSNNDVVFSCNDHAPFSDEELARAPVSAVQKSRSPDVKKTKTPDPEPPPPPRKLPKREGLYRGGTNLAAVYRNNPELKPPSGSQSRGRVECANRECRDVHELRDRKEWNGTHSNCPKCGEPVYTYAWEEETTA